MFFSTFPASFHPNARLCKKLNNVQDQKLTGIHVGYSQEHALTKMNSVRTKIQFDLNVTVHESSI